jgi:dienelactone hydrolase
MIPNNPMNVCFFHGLESDGPGRKGDHLASLDWSVFAPTINYRDPLRVSTAWRQASTNSRDAFVGSSMGGWMALLLASHTGTPAWLVNPAVIGRSFEPAFPEALGPYRPEVQVLLGKQDKLIDPKKAHQWLLNHDFQPQCTWADAGHRIAPDLFKPWITSISKEN